MLFIYKMAFLDLSGGEDRHLCIEIPWDIFKPNYHIVPKLVPEPFLLVSTGNCADLEVCYRCAPSAVHYHSLVVLLLVIHGISQCIGLEIVTYLSGGLYNYGYIYL